MASQLQTPVPAVVRVVLFWRAGCAHCHEVIEHVLPPLQEEYGSQLEILLVEVNSQEAANLLTAVAAEYGLPPERIGVPFLIVEDRVLIGSLEIPAELPGLIAFHLARGGVDWPDIPVLRPLLPSATDAAPPSATAPTSELPTRAAASADDDLVGRGPADPLLVEGFAPALGVMGGAAAALVYSGSRLIRRRTLTSHPGASEREILSPSRTRGIEVLALSGLVVSVYLSYVEITLSQAICGPIGDCNAVQASPYARLLGLVPIGVLGVAAYATILTTWVHDRSGNDPIARFGPPVAYVLAFVGTVFSLYLTFLEAFVIRAVCLWCLLSAATMAAILVLSPVPARPRPESPSRA
jgi:uncharacterized membrane protein